VNLSTDAKAPDRNRRNESDELLSTSSAPSSLCRTFSRTKDARFPGKVSFRAEKDGDASVIAAAMIASDLKVRVWLPDEGVCHRCGDGKTQGESST